MPARREEPGLALSEGKQYDDGESASSCSRDPAPLDPREHYLHNNLPTPSSRPEPSKRRMSGTSRGSISEFQSKYQEQRKRVVSPCGGSQGGDLMASSIGANVRVKWKGEELCRCSLGSAVPLLTPAHLTSPRLTPRRLHFAAIYMRWSVVDVLVKEMQRGGGDSMSVELSALGVSGGAV